MVTQRGFTDTVLSVPNFTNNASQVRHICQAACTAHMDMTLINLQVMKLKLQLQSA